MTMCAPWRIELFGWLRAVSDERTITRFRTHKTGALLAFLAYHSQRSHPREALIELLWPECRPEAGRQSLRKALSSLRLQLEPPGVPRGAVLVCDHDAVQVHPAAVETDVARFEVALRAASRSADAGKQAAHLIEAVDLYRGEVLPGYYDEWVLPERQRLSAVYLEALLQLARLGEQAGDVPGAQQWARRAVSADSLDEGAHQELIRLLIDAGESDAARLQYEDLQRLLADELGATPSPQTEALMRRLSRVQTEAGEPRPGRRVAARSGGYPRSGWMDNGGRRAPRETRRFSTEQGLKAAAPPRLHGEKAASLLPSAPKGSLPLQFTRFFGREAEIAWLCQELDRDEHDEQDRGGNGLNASPVRPDYPCSVVTGCRLLTLTGSGGSGKTRLSIEVAARLREAYRGGVWFVPLASLAEARLIVDQIRDTMRLPGVAEIEPLDQLVVALAARRSLLILDNFEHLVAEGAEVVRTLLERVASLTILVTSRQRLNLSAEREFPVIPLPVPMGKGEWFVGKNDQSLATDPDQCSAAASSLTSLPSVRLLVDRAQAVKPDFQVTPGNAGTVAALCRGLEGIPLALELAAARIGVLTPAQMLARLKRPFELLVSRERDITPRHRSLHAALDWSYQLLSADLQRFFARLSVFRGGWSLEAAEAVCDEPGALGHLEQLRDCSLVVADSGPDEVRFRLLETLREYAAERLTTEEQEAVTRRHLAYFRALAEQAEAEWASPKQAEWLARLEREHDNLRAALVWSQTEVGDLEQGLRLGAALYWFWHTRRYEREGWERLTELLARVGGARTAMRARAQAVAGFMALWLGNMEATRALSEESLAIGRELDDKWSIAFSLRNLGEVAEDFAAARSLLEEGRAIWQEMGNKWGVAMSLGRLGHLASNQGDLAAARALEEQSLALRRELGDRQGIAGALGVLGMLARLQGDPETARSLCEEGLAILRELGITGAAVWLLGTLGRLAFDRGDFSAALPLLEECLALRREQGNRHWIPEVQIQLAEVCLALGDCEAAQGLLTESLAYGRERGSQHCIATSLHHLAGVARRQNDLKQAAALYRESLAIQREGQGEKEIPASLEGLAAVATALGQPERAARLLAAACSLRAMCGVPLLRWQQSEHEEQLATLRATLGEAAFTAAWESGQALTWEQAVAEALEETTDL